LANNPAFPVAGAKIVRDPVALDAMHAQTALCELSCHRTSHSPETDDDDVMSLSHMGP